MAAPKQPDKASKARPPASSPEQREKQVIAAAYDLAEKQIMDGTASSQVISHFLKMGSARNRLEMANIQKDVALKQAKMDDMASAQRIEEMYGRALNAMRRYQGEEVEEEYEE